MPSIFRCVFGISTLMSLCCHFNVQGNEEKMQDYASGRIELDVSASKVIESAKFALTELQNLSDSGIYATLDLVKVHAAFQQNGIFHDNIILTIELSSPYLTGKNTSFHEVIIMEEHENPGLRSLAVDHFPMMNEDAIEMFWIRKIEAHRSMRDAVFNKVEDEANYAYNEADAVLSYHDALQKTMKHLSDDDLLSLVHSSSESESVRYIARLILDERFMEITGAKVTS